MYKIWRGDGPPSRYVGPLVWASPLLVLTAIEVIFRRVRHAALLANDSSWSRRLNSSGRSHPLNVRNSVEYARAVGYARFEQQPRDSRTVRRAVVRLTSDHLAGAVAFPCRAAEVGPTAVKTTVGVQITRRGDKVHAAPFHL